MQTRSEIWIRLSKKFLRTYKWRRVRKLIFNVMGKQCCRCGKKERQMHVDHIIPRSVIGVCVDKHIWLDPINLQPLCGKCNTSKGTDTKDYRNDVQYNAAVKLRDKLIASNWTLLNKPSNSRQRRRARKKKKKI